MKKLALENSEDLSLRDAVKLAGNGETVLLTEDGEGRYILGAVDDLELEAFSLSHNPDFMAYLDSCRERGRREGTKTLDEVKREFGL